MSRKSRTTIGIDIGTSKITVIVAEVHRDGVDVVGIGEQPSHGIKKGLIINMESTVDSIKHALEEAETMTGIDINATVVGISGNHIEGVKSNGVIPVNNKEIKKADIVRAMDAAKAIVIPTAREVIHIIPQEFIVDDQNGIKEPLGMSGVRLEAHVYIITGTVASIQNIIRCTNKTGVKVQDIILQQLASAEAVLLEDEKELGCALIDIGGGTTDIAVFHKGTIRHCAVLPIGGDHITSDIAIGIRTPISEAEEIKRHFGCADLSKVNCEREVEFYNIGDQEKRSVSPNLLCQIVEARVEEIFKIIKRELADSGFIDYLSSGAVLTGGSALLKGLDIIAKKNLGMPVRIGLPCGINGINDVKDPSYATGVGLILFSCRDKINRSRARGQKKNFLPFGQKMREWFTEAF